MDGWKMSFLLEFPIFRGYVKLRGGRCWRCRLASSWQHNAMTAATWFCIAHRIFLIGAEARIKVDLCVSIEMMKSDQICINSWGLTVSQFSTWDLTTWTACPVAGWWGGLPPPLVSLCWVHVGFHWPGEGGAAPQNSQNHYGWWSNSLVSVFKAWKNQFEQGGGAIFIHFHMLPW